MTLWGLFKCISTKNQAVGRKGFIFATYLPVFSHSTDSEEIYKRHFGKQIPKSISDTMFKKLALATKAGDDILTYDIKCGGSASQGYYLVEVSAYASKANKINQALVCRAAVHGVLFKGFSGDNGCTSQRPLAANAAVEEQHQEFFKPFFKDDGDYRNYASMVAGSMKTQKVGNQFKVNALVTVSKDRLRTDLEKAGIIKGLNSGF